MSALPLPVGPRLLHRFGYAEVVNIAQAHHFAIDKDGWKNQLPLLELLDHLWEPLPNLGP